MDKKVVFLLLFISTFAMGQRHELGVFLGGANGITDIGRTNYIYPVPVRSAEDGKIKVPFAIGMVYRWNFNPQMGLRANVQYARIVGRDTNAAEDFRFERGLEYDNDIYEASILFEYNFFDFNTIQKNAHTPFIFVGLGAFGTNLRSYNISHTLRQDNLGNPVQPTTDTDFVSALTAEDEIAFNLAIPFGLGYKFKVNYNWVFALEVGFRGTNTDRLDHSFARLDEFTINTDPTLEQNPFLQEVQNRNINFINSRQTGDISDTDWYVFSGLTLTYTFGRPPCYCN